MKLFYPNIKLKTARVTNIGEEVYIIPKGFEYRPSIPIFILNWLGTSKEKAYELALFHDYNYVHKLTSWWRADSILFNEIDNSISKFFLQIIFRMFSWIWWVT